MSIYAASPIGIREDFPVFKDDPFGFIIAYAPVFKSGFDILFTVFKISVTVYC